MAQFTIDKQDLTGLSGQVVVITGNAYSSTCIASEHTDLTNYQAARRASVSQRHLYCWSVGLQSSLVTKALCLMPSSLNMGNV